MIFPASPDGTEVGEFAIGYCAEVALVSLAQYFAMGLIDPIRGPVFGFGFVG